MATLEKKNKGIVTPYFDKKTTNIIKGIVLIFMFIHHMFTFPEAYIEGISYPALEPYARWLCNPFNMCVSLFAFLTGYCYFFVKAKTFKYAFRKITDILFTYWVIYGVLLVVALSLGSYRDITVKAFVMELFALNRIVMVFCWYVPFYIMSMLILTFVTRHIEDNRIKEFFFLLVVPVLVTAVLSEFAGNSVISGNLRNISEWFPCMAVGYLCASGAVFQNIFDRMLKLVKWKAARLCICFFLATSVFLLRHYVPKVTLITFSLAGHPISVSIFADIIYAPIFIYATVNILRILKLNAIYNVIGEIGKYSLYMWFFHCIFFNVSQNVFQPILYFPRNPILVILWGLLLCYGVSRLLALPIKKLLDFKERCINYFFYENKRRGLNAKI